MTSDMWFAACLVCFVLGIAFGGFMMWLVLTQAFEERLDRFIREMRK